MDGRRSQPAGEVLRKLRRELERGWAPGLTVLTGDDLYHLDRAQAALLSALVPAESSPFALTVFGEARVDLAVVVSAARSAGMFARRRVVLVREIAALEGEPDVLAAYAVDPPQDSYLLVRAPVLDRRRKLHQALAGSGRQLVFARAAGAPNARLEADVRTMASEKGLSLEPAASALLLEVCAGDLYRVDSELEKIRTWVGLEAGGPVTPAQVREVVAGSGLLSGWEVADALLLRDREAALAALRRLVQAGEEPLRMLGGLAYRARGMLQAKGLMEQGQGTERAIRALRAWSYERELLAGLSRYSMQDLLAFPSALLEADRTLKSRSVDPLAVLESLVDKLAAPAATGQAGGG